MQIWVGVSRQTFAARGEWNWSLMTCWSSRTVNWRKGLFSKSWPVALHRGYQPKKWLLVKTWTVCHQGTEIRTHLESSIADSDSFQILISKNTFLLWTSSCFLDKRQSLVTHQEKVHHPEEEKEFHGFFLLSQEFSSLHSPCTPSQTYC